MSPALLLALALTLAAPPRESQIPILPAPEPPAPVDWPEAQRAFLDDGPGWLLAPAERERFRGLAAADRERYVVDFLARDPLPESAENELAVGIERRRRYVLGEFFTFADERARVAFLNGPPVSREPVECGFVFRPLELWSYGGEAARTLVFFRPSPDSPFRLWRPLASKGALYTSEMEYLLEQWEELAGRIQGRRIDRVACDLAEKVDRATGVDGLAGFERNRPTEAQLARWLAPPDDLAAWARAAAAMASPAAVALSFSDLRLLFPAARGQRLLARLYLSLPPEAPISPFVEGEKSELRLAVEGRLEQNGVLFEEFRSRFVFKKPQAGAPVVLALERALRPGGQFLLRLRVRDEVGGAAGHLARAFAVPLAAEPERELPVPESAVAALGEELATQRLGGRDSLLLVPPAVDVVFGLWRAEAIVTGSRIEKVVFQLDGKPQLTRAKPPWSAELRLPNQPSEWLVRAEGLDAAGVLVAADEVILNQPQGEPKVTILAPRRGAQVSGEALAKASVVVPEGRAVERVEFRVNDTLVATRLKPPWEAPIAVASRDEVTFLAVAAYFNDGSRAEDVRFLNAPQFLEEVRVDLVELYTTVLDRNGRPVDSLAAADFTVLDAGKPQKLAKFELMRNLPLTLGLALDFSGSMQGSLAEAKKAAVGFLESVVTPRDRCFAVGFADEPQLLMPPTPDVEALRAAFTDLPALGGTALHDALVFALYYFRGVPGRRALVVLSDGDDTASKIPFRDALEFARKSGVVVYTIGLDVGRANVDIRLKLNNLAEETGGRSFYIAKAEELAGVYEEIERELRSQYLLAFSPQPTPPPGKWREVEVKVKGSGLKARTARGYYP